VQARKGPGELQLKVFLAGRIAVEADAVVIDEGRFPGRQGRLLFAYLVAEEGRPVPRDELAEAVWGDSPPATWEKALTVVVSKLRALLADLGLDGTTVLTGAFGCYRLELPEGSWVDVVAAANAAKESEEALAVGDLEEARTAATLAASLVRHPFLPGEEGAWVEEQRRDLADVRDRALATLADACLRSGNASEAVKWAEQTIALSPFRETGYRRLMEAHIAGGNRAEALHVYERCRRLLADELGSYPSPETESIYRGLLEAPTVAAVAVAAEPPAPDATTLASAEPEAEPETPSYGRVSRRRRLGVVAVAIAVTAAVVAGALAARGGGTQAAPVAANSVVALEPSGSIAATVPVGARPVAITPAGSSLWVANLDDRSVTRIDVPSGQAVRSIPVDGMPAGLAATGKAVWVSDGTGDLARIDPRYNRLADKQPLRASVGFFGGTARPALAAFGSLWIVSPDGVLLRLDPRSARVLDSVAVGNQPSAITSGADSVWVANGGDGTVTRIDPTTLVADTIPVGNGPAAIAVNDAGAWVANSGDNTLARIDLATNAVAETATVGDGPAAVVATSSALWVANSRDGTVMRLDPRSGQVSKTIPLGGAPNALASTGGKVWVAIAPAPPQSPPEGGARITISEDYASLDPAVGLARLAPWLYYATCANLVTHPAKPAPMGSRIVPEVAEKVPSPTAGGTLYTFRIRDGIRFSPPSNEPVTAMTFKSTIERLTDPRLKSPFATGFSGIVGYEAHVTGKASGISGIVARGDTLTIRLARPDGGLLARLASGGACAVPRDTPVAGGLNEIPSAGPYYVASYTPRQQLVLERNPNYTGNRPRRLDQIVFAIGIDPAQGLQQVEAGEADFALELPREAGPRLESAYGPGSEAAKAEAQQYFVNEALGMRILHMNMSRPLFSDVRLRRAVNYAIDRRALAAQGRRAAEVNPFNAGTPTDDYFPPAVAGAEDSRLYPVTGPDFRRAKRLAGSVRATAIMYTPNLSPWREEAQIVRRNLKPLGIDVQVKEFPIGDFFTRVTRRGEPFDLAVSGYWMGADPVATLLFLFGEPGSAPVNISHYEDAAFARKLAAAAKLSGTKRYRAASSLALELQRYVVPAAAFATTASRDFFSARIGCQLYQPVWGIDLAALCLKN
jgi:YVTN family beta-propeller protein